MYFSFPHHAFHFLQWYSFGFGNKKGDPQQLKNHHPQKNSEYSLRSELFCHKRENQGDQSGKKPVSKTSQRLSHGALSIRKNFTDKHPDHGSLPDGMGGYECKNVNRYQTDVSGSKSPGRQSQRNDIADRSDIKQFAATQPVDEPQSHKRKDQVGNADRQRRYEGGLGLQYRQFTDTRRQLE